MTFMRRGASPSDRGCTVGLTQRGTCPRACRSSLATLYEAGERNTQIRWTKAAAVQLRISYNSAEYVHGPVDQPGVSEGRGAEAQKRSRLSIPASLGVMSSQS